jgi:hypothetical protein
MEPPVALSTVCHLPVMFRGGNKSFVQLVSESGVSKGNLTTEALVPFLKENSSLIEDWLRWSEDKRASSGWFFRQEDGGYIVGEYPNGERLAFQTAAAGCAAFIVKEVAPYAL